ncbi:MAG: RNA methyltransferase [Holosporales bacterium]|nr:RNA methyltransferase [Holosporales bacterium]
MNKKRVIEGVWMSAATMQAASTCGVFDSPFFEAKKPVVVDKIALDRMFAQPVVHQGIVVKAQPLSSPPLSDLRQNGQASQVVVVLDQVTDPQNVGSILRLCRAFNADGMIMTAAHAPPETGAMAKVASGALEFVPRYIVPNLAHAVRQLKTYGFWVVGLAERGGESIRDVNLTGKIALVLGSEGSGMRKLTLDLCDFKAFLPTCPSFSTLNVTTAAAISLYEAFLAQHLEKRSPLCGA